MQRSQHALGTNQVPGTSQNLSRLIELQELTSRSEGGRTPARRQIEQLREVIPLELLRSCVSAAERGRAAVARITDSGACGACHLNLPSGMAARMQVLSDRVQKCPHCGCFLCPPLARRASEPLTTSLPAACHPGRSIRVLRHAPASRSKVRTRALPPAAPGAVDSKPPDPRVNHNYVP